MSERELVRKRESLCLCHMHTRDQGRIKEKEKIRRQLDRMIIKREMRESEKEGRRRRAKNQGSGRKL